MTLQDTCEFCGLVIRVEDSEYGGVTRFGGCRHVAAIERVNGAFRVCYAGEPIPPQTETTVRRADARE